MPSDDEYRPLWQTWTLVRARQSVPLSVPVDAPVATPDTEPLRQRLQRARIQRQWSVADLATHVPHCDAATLAAFERGDDTMSSEMQRTLRRVLDV